jgi:hypothetical protein
MSDSRNHRAMAINNSQAGEGMCRDGWFSLYFWPAFRRIFLLDNKLEVWQRRSDPRPAAAALGAKRRNHEVPSSAVPRVVIDTQLEYWIQWTLECNIALAATLKRLRDSYKLLQTGKRAEDAEGILAEVEELLNWVEQSNM